MLKKILFAVAGGVVALLVLAFALVLLLSYREFFGTPITLVLCACVVALAAFVVYLVIRYILDARRKGKHDEDTALSEHHIKEMLLSGEPRDKGVIRDGATELSALASSTPDAGTPAEAQSTSLFDTGSAAPRAAQAAPEAGRASQRTAELHKLEEEHRRRLAEAEARAHQAAQAQQAARSRAASDTGRRHLAGTGELLRRTSELAAQQPAAAPAAAPAAPAANASEVQSVRRQAEAAAAARRRAAQMAARSQSFPAIRPDTLAGIKAQDSRPNLYDEAANSTVRYANEPVPFEASGEDSIWDRMQVRRSAAPLLTQDEQRSRPEHTALEDITGDFAPVGYTDEIRAQEKARRASPPPPPVRQRTGSIRLEAVQEAVTEREGAPATAQGWQYTPAKPPKAWNTSDAGHRIPGDMSSATTAPAPGGTPDARAVAAAERKAAAKGTQRDPDSKAKEAAAKAEKAAAARKAATDGRTDAEAKSVYRKTDAPAAAAPAAGADGEVKRPRGRPPKPKTEEELNAPKRPRGRPPKPKTEEELNAPKRPRGRPPKPKTEEELNAPKRPRGRPRKDGTTAAAPEATAKDATPPAQD